MSINPNYGVQGYGGGGYGNDPIESLQVGYYTDLLTSEYQPPSSPKLNAFLYLLLKKFDDVTQCFAQMDVAFNLSYAVGVQLDTLGSIVGVKRTVGFQPTNGVSPILDDNTFRIYIRYAIAANQWDGTIPDLYALWNEMFLPGSPPMQITIIDNQNMTAEVSVTGASSSILTDLVNNGYIVPRPEGVLYNVGFANLPAFGADLNNLFVAGADLGHAA